MPARIAILHYTAPPVVGGVEAVIHAHARHLTLAGCELTVIAGQGDRRALPAGTRFELVPEMDSQHPAILDASRELERGVVPPQFESLVGGLETILSPLLEPFDNVIMHNLFTKHFNLPLTIALRRLLVKAHLHGGIAWCHDFTWSSPHSRSKVHPGFPWDDLRTAHPGLAYVTVSRSRQAELAGLLGVTAAAIKVVYNAVDPRQLLALSQPGESLVDRLDLWNRDLLMLVPVRITQAKNIEFAFQVTAELKQHAINPLLLISGPPDPHEAASLQYYQSLLELRSRMVLDREVRFVYESGPQPDTPYLIGYDLLAELYRACDLLFMPSHREGFGMPVLEAGLVGLPVVSAEIPAAAEIGGQEVITFPADEAPGQVARRILAWAEGSRQYRLRKRIRRTFTWKAITEHDILPLLKQSEAA